MRDTLRKAKPQCLEDLIALNALYRPGPLRGGVVDDYITASTAASRSSTSCRRWSPCSKRRTASSRIRNRSCGWRASWPGSRSGQADELRRAMGKKDAAKMQAQRDGFMTGCASAASPRRRPTKIFEFIEFFAGYGFKKSHSTTYALLAYQTAYLKANYPHHFMAALLTIESQNSDKIALYLAECRELGVPMLPPDINASELQFVVQPDGVRFGLGAVKGAGEGAILSILETRRTLGGRDHVAVRARRTRRPSAGEQEGARSAGQGRRVRFARAGGAPSYLAWRPRLLAGLDRILDHGSRHQKDRDQGQELLFGGDDRTRHSRGRRRRAAGCARLDGDRSAGVREGSARPVHERPSAPALRRRAGRDRRAAARPSLTQSEADVHRRRRHAASGR